MTLSGTLISVCSRSKLLSSVAPEFLCGSFNGMSVPFMQRRWRTRSRRVEDRSSKKRVHNLETVTERWKVASKVTFLMDALSKEPDQIIPARKLEQYRQQISLCKPHKVSDFVAKSPKLFELFRDKKGLTWCGLTKEAVDLMEEEKILLDQHKDKAAEYITRMLMMSVDRRLPIDKIVHFRREFGMPSDFREEWIHKFPENFRVINADGVDHVELVTWNPDWAVTELEKRAMAVNEFVHIEPGILSLSFPLKFPSNFKKIFRIGGKIDHFQKTSYLSPYADAKGLVPGTQEFDKRAVAIMHELLSFTMEKRLVTDHLTHFRREFIMPQKLMRLLLKHFAIFYVSERGKRFNVFLTEAYDGSELIEKCPLVIWKEKILSLTGYRGKMKRVKNFDEFSDTEGYSVSMGYEYDDTDISEFDFKVTNDTLEKLSLLDDAEMEVGDVHHAYKDTDAELQIN